MFAPNLNPMLGLGGMPGAGLGGAYALGEMIGLQESLAMSRLGGAPGFGGLSMLGNPMGMQNMATQMILGQIMQLLMGLLMNQMGGLGGLGGGGLGSPGLSGGGGGFGGAPDLSGGAMPGDLSSPGQGGQAACQLAQQCMGVNSINLKGKLPHFTAAGGADNDCADFVSSILETTEGLHGHFVNVRGLEQALISQGWREVPASMAQPGDVWISAARGHTELVAQAGGQRLIGSNNNGHDYQTVSTSNAYTAGVYYHRG